MAAAVAAAPPLAPSTVERRGEGAGAGQGAVSTPYIFLDV